MYSLGNRACDGESAKLTYDKVSKYMWLVKGDECDVGICIHWFLV
jgi:hypothetical protein